MAHNSDQSIFDAASRDVGFEPIVKGWLSRLVTGVEQALQRRRERRQLAEMDEHQLHDLGLSRADVDRETSKPFWR